MAYRTTRRRSSTRARSGYARGRRTSARSTYRSRASSSRGRRTASARSRGARATTVRIELHGMPANPVARPATAGEAFMTAVQPSPTATKPRF